MSSLFFSSKTMTVQIKKPNIPGLASGSFVRGPDESAATVDIYSVGKDAKSGLGLSTDAVAKTYTSVKDLSVEVSGKLDNFINDQSGLADWLDKTKSGLGLKISESDLTKRLVGASSDFKGAFGELTESMRTGARIELSKDTLKTVKAGIGDVQALVSASKINDARSLGNFFNKYTKSSSYKTEDAGAVSSILTGVVSKSQELGINNMYTSLVETLDNNEILGKLTKTLIPIALAKNYPNLLKQISSGPYSRMINTFAPGFSKTLSKTFSMKGSAGLRPITTFDDLIGTMDRANNRWMKTKRNGDDDVFDLSDLIGGNRDFQRLIFSGVSYFVTDTTKSAGHAGSVGNSIIAGNSIGAFDRANTANGAAVYGVYGLAGFYSQQTPAAAVKKHFPKVAMSGTYDLTIPRPTTVRNNTVRRTTQNDSMNPRMWSHILSSLF